MKILLTWVAVTLSRVGPIGYSSHLWSRLLRMHGTLTRFRHLSMCVSLNLLWSISIGLSPRLSSSSLRSLSLPTWRVRASSSNRHIVRIVDLGSYTLLSGFHAWSWILRHILLMGWWSFSWGTTTILLTWLEAIVDDKCWLVYIQMGRVCWIVQVIIYITALSCWSFSWWLLLSILQSFGRTL